MFLAGINVRKNAEKILFLTYISFVYLLINYEKLCVCDISDILNISQSATSQHLRKLKDGNVIDNVRDGATIFYFINDDIKHFFENSIKE